MEFKDFIFCQMTELQILNFRLKYDLYSQISVASGRGEKKRIFEEIAAKYNITVESCRQIYYSRIKK